MATKAAITTIRSKLPSKPWAAFFSAVGFTVTLAQRDRYLCEKEREKLLLRARPLAEEVLPTLEQPRKVTLYLTAPPGDGLHKSRAFFKHYIKPIWDAAALDYEVKEGSKPGDVQKHVGNRIRRDRRRTVSGASASPVLESSSGPEGIVALGRGAFVEVVNGLSEGSFGPVYNHELHVEAISKGDDDAAVVATTETGTETGTEKKVTPEEVPVASTSEDAAATSEQPVPVPAAEATDAKDAKPKKKTKLEIEDELALKEAQSMSESDLAALESSQIPPTIPPLGYLTFRNIIGWTNMPRRLYAWFTDHEQVRRFGEEALLVALNSKRRPNDAEEWRRLGRREEDVMLDWSVTPPAFDCDPRISELFELYA